MSHLHHKVSALIDGELSPHARSRALAHARTCPSCRQEISETLDVKRRVNKLAPVEVSADLLEVVASITPTPRPGVPSGRSTLLRKAVISVGSLSAVVIALAYVVGAPPEATQASTVSPPVEEFTAEFADSTGLAPLSDPVVGASSAGGTESVSFGGSQTWRPPSSSQGVGTPPNDPQEAVQLLERAVTAPERVAFEGTKVVRSMTPGGNSSFVVQVHHVPQQGTVFDVRGTASEPSSSSFVSASEAADDGLEGKPIAPLLAAYDVVMDGSQVIDGRHTSVISASQNGQVSARFWIDDATGILLRRAMYVGGRLVRMSGFTSITTSRHGFMQHLPPEMQALPATTLSPTIAEALNDKGWTCPVQLSRDFHLSFLHQVDAAGGAMHAEYTDGLSTVSVFEERGALDPSTLGGFHQEQVGGDALYVRAGLPTVAVWQSGETVFTVVTDAPEQLTGALLSRFPHVADQPTSGVATRISKGLSRMVSAVAP